MNLPQQRAFSDLPLPTNWLDRLPTWLTQKQRVSNWLVALAFASTLGLSAAASVALINRPVTTPTLATSSYTGSAASIPASKVLPIVGDSPINPVNESAQAQIATLQGQVASMNSDLQHLQQDSAALRNETQNQASGLAAAQANLAGSEEGLQGESHELTSRLDATQHDVQSRVGSLDDQITSADQLVNDVRKLLGLPTTSNSAVGGGN